MKSNLIDALLICCSCRWGKETLDSVWLVFKNLKSCQEGVACFKIRFNVIKRKRLTEQFLIWVDLTDSPPLKVINFNFLLIRIVSKYCFLVCDEIFVCELFLCQQHVIHEVCDISFVRHVAISPSKSWSLADIIQCCDTFVMPRLIIWLFSQLFHVPLL